ncbi:hypothetical protein AVEN_31614-1 [Araneus ventricosus]|uniref:RNase H type-1 domain-containing protein n=1 Tax=Araneus ventricosus TaxID=182803 RepID=A0A4Y2NXS6_ARAVE|nr:hypothetical protein AVEN_31614-1 [Araneus ventricosus]
MRVLSGRLIHPLLDPYWNGFQILQTASATNLKKLERIQLSAAPIITGVRNSCPNEIVLYEADLQPLTMRWSPNLSRYFKVEPCSLWPSLNSLEDLPRVFFHEKLLSFSSKKDQHPVLHKQLALETTHNTPLGAVRIFTDESQNDNGNTGNGVVIKTPDAIAKIKKRNPNFCSVFRSELMAIDEALDHMISNNSSCDIWIFTGSRSSIQFLSNWRNIGDKTGTNIVNKLRIYSSHNDIHLQWIPSHVDLFFNDLVDELAR